MKNQSLETDSEMSEMTELVDEDIKTAIKTTFFIFKKVGRDTEDMIEEKDQIKLLEVKITISIYPSI